MRMSTNKGDIKTINEIKSHIKDIQHEFSQGNFTKPFYIHAQDVLGTEVMTAKKGLEFKDEYMLLEVCNPSAAKQALESNPEIGLLLPCTIAIYQKNNENFISLAKPTALLANIPDNRLDKFGQEMGEKLVSAIQKIK